MVIIKLDSREFLCDGVSIDRKHIHNLLRQMSLFLSDKFLKHWLGKYVEETRNPKVLSPAEFLCLISNASDRTETILKLPYTVRDLTPEKDTGLYPLDPGVRLNHPADPEKWMQREGNTAFSRARIVYYKDADGKRTKLGSPRRKDRQRTSVKEQFEADLKALLGNPGLRGEIQTTLEQFAKILPVTRAQASVVYTQRKAEEIPFTPVIDMIHMSDASRRRRRAFAKKVQSLGSSLSLSLAGETVDAETRVSSRPVSGSTRPQFAQHRSRPFSAKTQSMSIEPSQLEVPAGPQRYGSVGRGVKKSKKVPRWQL